MIQGREYYIYCGPRKRIFSLSLTLYSTVIYDIYTLTPAWNCAKAGRFLKGLQLVIFMPSELNFINHRSCGSRSFGIYFMCSKLSLSSTLSEQQRQGISQQGLFLLRWCLYRPAFLRQEGGHPFAKLGIHISFILNRCYVYLHF